MTVRPADPSGTPAAPFWLGWAGVLPFAALAFAAVTRLSFPIEPARLLIGYGSAILSFMGGAQWGLATAAGQGSGGAPPRRFAVSVVPALVAWPALFLPPPHALATLALGFAALCAYDIGTVRRGEAPGWYGRLRMQLTAAVVILLMTTMAVELARA